MRPFMIAAALAVVLAGIAWPNAGLAEEAAAIATAAAAAPAAPAAAAPAVPDFQFTINMVWTCLAAFLVFFMQAGFALVETGFTRAKNCCNIMMKNTMDFCLGSVAWYCVGFGLMFGLGGGAFVGYSHFFGNGSITDVNPMGWTYWIFQCVFAATAATIVSGAMAERTKFSAYLIYSFVVSAAIYPVSGHWIWNADGWLAKLGFIDFAGSTVVHSCGGWLALAGAIVLGPRIGKYGPDGKARAIMGHSIPLASLGVFILWFGWFGFNPGSTTAAIPSIGHIAVTTNLAACTGAIAALLTAWLRYGKPDTSMTLNGVLAGLVAVTAGCNNVGMPGALAIGAIAGVVVVLSVEFIDKVLRIDDPVGAVSVHCVCGVLGTFLAAVFNDPSAPAGLAEASILTQLKGIGAMAAWSFGLGMLLFTILKYTIGLRVKREEELRGLDIDEHGNEAYAGFQIFSNQ